MGASPNANAAGKEYLDQKTDSGAYLQGGLLSESATDGIGYGTGAGAAVTQLTNRSTSVEINTICGVITTDDASLAAGSEAKFTVNNSAVKAVTDLVKVCLQATGTGTPFAFVSAVAVGSFEITITNFSAGTADTTADPINFTIEPSVAA